MIESSPSAPPVEVRLKDLRVREEPIAITARIVQIERKEIQRKSDGQRRPVLAGLLSDGTATVRFTWWDPPREEIDRGTVIRAAPVQVREFQGRPELSFGWKTRVAPASDHELPDIQWDEVPVRPLNALAPRDEGIRVEVRVVEVSAKSVTVGEERRQLFQGLLADRTALVAFTAWADFRLAPGEAIRILGGYVRLFRGRPQLVLDERSRVDRIDGAGLPAAEELPGEVREPLGVLAEGAGAERARVEGRALALQPPSGLVFRCPSCQRLLKSGACRSHGVVEGVADLRLRLVLDDGTGTITLNLDRPAVERLTGRTLSSCLELLRSHPDPATVEAELFRPLFGHRFRARGPVTKDEFGLSMFPTEIEGANADPVRLQQELERRLAGSPA